MRLYTDATHYLEGVKIEVKPLEHGGWLSDQRYKHAVRY